MIRRQDGNFKDRSAMQLEKQAALCRRLAQGAVPFLLMRELSALAEEFERDAYGLDEPTSAGQADLKRLAAG
jgi:hypothetical protein